MIYDSEGFEPKPYPDPLSGGEPFTFGHGLTYITEDESKLIIERRVKLISGDLAVTFPWFNILSPVRKAVIVNMVYQLGMPRFQKFRRTITYLQYGEYEAASVEMLDSSWYRQMHELDMKDGVDEENRAEWLSWMMANDEYRERRVS